MNKNFFIVPDYKKLLIIISCTFIMILQAKITSENKHIPAISELYQNISGFCIENYEAEEIKKLGSSPTYGEITPEAVKSLIADLKLTEKDVFYDLGSGVGKMVVQFYLESPVKKSAGYELSPTRNNHALRVKNNLATMGLLEKGRSLDFIQKDLFEADLRDATIVYLPSTCFSDDFMKRLTEKLSYLKKGLRVLTLRTLPPHKSFMLRKTYSLPMTWAKQVSVYLYELQ